MITRLLDNKRIGKNLKDLRARKKKTISDLSNETGLKESALRNYECGIRIPNYKAMFTLADYYGTTVDYIFFTGKRHNK